MAVFRLGEGKGELGLYPWGEERACVLFVGPQVPGSFPTVTLPGLDTDLNAATV